MDEIEQIKTLGHAMQFAIDHPKLRDLPAAAAWLWAQGCGWSVSYGGLIPMNEVRRHRALKSAQALVDAGLWKVRSIPDGWSMRLPSLAVPVVAPAPSQPVHGPIAMTFDTVGNPQTWHLSEAYLQSMEKTYAPLDVRAHCRYAQSWLTANPSKRKTARGMPRFLVSWMMRAIDRPGAAAAVVKAGRTGPAPMGKYAGVADD